MYNRYYTKHFQKSVQKVVRSGKISRAEIESMVDLIAQGGILPSKYRDHQLKGIFQEYRECHVRGDLLLVYQIHNKNLILLLIDIGSHSYLGV